MLSLDFGKRQPMRIWAKQKDTGRVLEFQCVKDAVPIDITNCIITLNALKKDGTYIYNNGEIQDATNGKVTFPMTNQLLAVVGEVKADVSIYYPNGTILTSSSFTFDIDETIRNDEAIESSSEFTELTKAILAESNRVLAENGRVTAENNRVSAETARVNAENARQIGYATMDGRINQLFETKVNYKNACSAGLTTLLEDASIIINDLIANNNKVYIPNGVYNLKNPIIIKASNRTLLLDENVLFNCTNANNAFEIGSEQGETPLTDVLLINPRATGDNKQGNGILLKKCGYHCEIRNPYMWGFAAGIKTAFFDCFQINTIYEPYLGGNIVGIDDTAGGLQTVRIFGGRIEQNVSFGVITSSPNAKFIGSMIEGNGDEGEMELVSDAGHNPSVDLVNVYFEKLNKNLSKPVIVANTTVARVSLTNCTVFAGTDYMIYSTNDIDIKVDVIGGTYSISQMLYLPNANESSILKILKDVKYQGENPDKDVSPAAAMIYLTANTAKVNEIRTTQIWGTSGAFSPMLQLMSSKYIFGMTDSASPSTDFKTFTMSNTAKPWDTTSAGILPGSMHYVVADKKLYVRVKGKTTPDIEANWAILAQVT